MQNRYCYICAKPATSDEHAPPKCLFPETKDTIDGTNYRINLITVPSCDEHNSAKSHHDEYLLQALAGSYTSSEIALQQFCTKVKRAFEKRPSKAEHFVKISRPVKLKREHENGWEDGAQITVEGERLDIVLENCARALFFHETGRRIEGKAQVITGFTLYMNEEIQDNITKSIEASNKHFQQHPQLGANPKIFWYKYQEGRSSITFLMRFYEYSEVIVRLFK
jgi:hypothetical protein